MKKRDSQSSRKRVEFDKYDYYQRAVQSPEAEVEFIHGVFKKLKGRLPMTLREDFCGTHLLCCEWVKYHSKAKAYGIDLDAEPLLYGQKNYVGKLSPLQQARVLIAQDNVLRTYLPSADVIVAFNFSYFTFKERSLLKSYFKNVYKVLEKDGIFILDCFGGSNCYEANEEETAHKDFSYFWDQDTFNPVNQHSHFYIHFKRKGEKKREKVFSYDWRLWSLPEIRDILDEVGFKKTHVFWEGTDKNGEGDGQFKKTEKGEECKSWIAYILAEKIS